MHNSAVSLSYEKKSIIQREREEREGGQREGEKEGQREGETERLGGGDILT